MTESDDMVRIANQLRQALSQVSGAGAKTYLPSTAGFLEQVTKAVAEGDVRGDICAEDVAEAICASVLGCHLLSDAIGDDPYARLARAWRVLMPAIASAEGLPYFQDFLARTVARYTYSGAADAPEYRDRGAVGARHRLNRRPPSAGAARGVIAAPQAVPAELDGEQPRQHLNRQRLAGHSPPILRWRKHTRAHDRQLLGSARGRRISRRGGPPPGPQVGVAHPSPCSVIAGPTLSHLSFGGNGTSAATTSP